MTTRTPTSRSSGSRGTTTTAMTAALLTDEGPDVFEFGNGPNIDMIQSGQVVPLDGILGDAESDFNQRMIQRLTYDGHLWAVPQMIDMHAARLPQEPARGGRRRAADATLDDLIAAAAQLTTGDTQGLVPRQRRWRRCCSAGCPLWSAGADYLTEDNQFGLRQRRRVRLVRQGPRAVRERLAAARRADRLVRSRRVHQRADGDAAHRAVDVPGCSPSEIGDDFDVDRRGRQLDASTGAPSLPFGAFVVDGQPPTASTSTPPRRSSSGCGSTRPTPGGVRHELRLPHPGPATASPRRPIALSPGAGGQRRRACQTSTAFTRRRCCGRRRPTRPTPTPGHAHHRRGRRSGDRDRRGRRGRRGSELERMHARGAAPAERCAAWTTAPSDRPADTVVGSVGRPSGAVRPGAADRSAVAAAHRCGGDSPGTQNNNVWFWVFVGPFVVGLGRLRRRPDRVEPVCSACSRRATPCRRPSSSGCATTGDMLRDPAFRSSLLTFVAFAAFIVPLTFACSLGARAAREQGHAFAKAFFRSVFFLPVACSYVVASLIWKVSIFNGVRFGLANTVLRAFGFEGRQWLSRPRPAAVLGGDRQRAAVAAGRASTCCCSSPACSASRRCSTRRPRSTARHGRLADVPATSRSRSCGRRRRRCWCCC